MMTVRDNDQEMNMAEKEAGSSKSKPRAVKSMPTVAQLEHDIQVFLEGGTANKSLFRRIAATQKCMPFSSPEAINFYKLAACASMRHMGLHHDRRMVTRLIVNTPNTILKHQLLEFLNKFSGANFDLNGNILSRTKKLPSIGNALKSKFPLSPAVRSASVKLSEVLGGLEKQFPKYDLSCYSNDQLMQIWRLSVRELVSKAREKDLPSLLNDLLKLINNEWIRRFKGKVSKDGYFVWPKTSFVSSSLYASKIHKSEIPQSEGVLSFFGYRVGKSQGLNCNHRQVLLMEIFNAVIPPFFPLPYLQEWGMPGTSSRLKKMANTIAAEVRNAKRRTADIDQAISEWEADLLYLYQTLYVGKFRFKWPA